MDHSVPKYFWKLDSEIPTEYLEGYREALDRKSDSVLAKIVELIASKVPIPPRAYLTSACLKLADKKPGQDFFQELGSVIERFERATRLRFGNKQKPLLLTIQGDFCGSVRNIGSSPETLAAMAHFYGPTQAFGSYVDFLESYSTLVLGCPHIDFRKTFGIQYDREKNIDGLKDESESGFLEKVRQYQNVVGQKIGREFPLAIEQHLITTLIYAARSSKGSGGDEIFLTVQLHPSIFGQSVKGVAYTRNPFTGKKDLYGIFQSGSDGKKGQLEAQGIDTEEAERHGDGTSLRERFPGAYNALKKLLPKVEAAYRDVMEAEFTTDEDGHLYFTGFDKAQTTARAGVVSTIELCTEGRISDSEAALRIRPNDVELLLHPTLDDKSRAKLKDLGSAGVTAAPGTAVGHVFFKMADAMEFYREAMHSKADKRVILIADELLISDTPGLGIISGLVTTASGIASHAAVMARANGIPCIVGYKGIEFDSKGAFCKINGVRIKAGTLMTLEAGAEGRLFQGEGTLQNLSFREGLIKDVSQLITRVIKEERIPVEVRVNINNAKDAEVGLSFGADAVGLCRTENMFMEPESLREIRNIVFTRDPSLCTESIEKLEEIQFNDFRKIFEVMRERVVNIRLMDLPLHDFVPQTETDFNELAGQLKHLGKEHLRGAAESLKEHNPMLGLRACRFGIINPEVYEMQIRAIVRAAYTVSQAKQPVDPGIMFPLVFTEAELTRLRAKVIEIEEKVREGMKIPFSEKIHFRVGTMLELPAAALGADHLAKVGEFFAFGTNDLTQTTLGMSRDDAAHYLPMYLEKGILSSDPFKVLAEPVKELVETAARRGRRVRPDASFGICGEQGGDPTTLGFCLDAGLDYVSCSPFRVLPGRVSLVRVALLNRKKPTEKAGPKAERAKQDSAA